jgi:SAM-dependent methyltransferase
MFAARPFEILTTGPARRKTASGAPQPWAPERRITSERIDTPMIQRLHRIRFPHLDTQALQQDEAWFVLYENGEEVRLRFHDYEAIYARPGLYEQLFYQRLRCNSPAKARDVLNQVLRDNGLNVSELRLLDLGAGNGMVGELLQASRTVGVDIFESARSACERDRPGAYDAYYVVDMTDPDHDHVAELREWQFDALSCIAALGFGDIPVAAFANAYNLVSDGGWVIFNIKESFMREWDQSGFSRLIKDLLLKDTLEVHHLERYRHRVSIDGAPLFYYVLCGRKLREISPELIASCSR